MRASILDISSSIASTMQYYLVVLVLLIVQYCSSVAVVYIHTSTIIATITILDTSSLAVLLLL